MLTKASTRSKPYASLSTATLTFSSLVFVLILKESFIRKRFCKPHWDERLNSAKRFFLKEKNSQWMICTRHSATRWQHTRYSSAVCEQNWKFFSFDYGNGTRLRGYGWSRWPVHGTFLSVDAVDFRTELQLYLPRPPSFSILDNLVFIVIGIPIYLRYVSPYQTNNSHPSGTSLHTS